MGEARFYHLTRTPLETMVARLAERARAEGLRVLVRSPDAAWLRHLDDRLWTEPEDGFLPHGLEDAPLAAEQPVLLATRAGRPNGAECVLLAGGADADPEEARAVARLCILFDGRDPAQLARARDDWRRLVAAGIRAQYWAEETGRWQMKAER